MLKFNLLLAIFTLLTTSLLGQSGDTKFSSLNDRSFIENLGQFDGRNWQSDNKIEFAVSENPFYLFFSKKGVTYRFDKIIKDPNRDKSDPYAAKRTNISELVHVEWVGANANVNIIAEEKVTNEYSYAVKDFSTQQVSNIAHVKGYKKVTYKNIYNNIDIEYVFHPEGGVKYSVILYPGANPNDVQLKYTTSMTNVGSESIEINLNTQGQINIKTSLIDLIEDKPFSYYSDSENVINSAYRFDNNVLTFDLDNYDNTKKVIIDPWLNNSTYSTSSAVWEVETDGSGNVYTIGGETPMELKKFNAAGVLQWTYVTPWDTSNTWLGTLATDDLGTSYVTSGTSQEIERIDNNGNMVWHANNPGFSQEYWSITFNCDNTKLIVGGTETQSLLSFDYKATIFDIDINNGSVISSAIVATTTIGGIGTTPVEVRSISSSKNAKYIFLTHNDVGAINQDLTCPNSAAIFQLDNQDNLGYKCENYLPATQNGGGLKALVANDTYFYTHSGDQIRQWDLVTGALVNTVTLVGGVSTVVPFIGGVVVENSGLDVDDCGNVYAGSTNSVVKFDQNLNVLSTSPTTFTVYDVSVNSNGEVLAIGAQSDNSASSRNGRTESINMSACAQYSLVCCDASFCEPGPLCDTDAAINLTANTSGGTWTSVPATAGLNATTGDFDPVVAGPGTYTVTYTIACGTDVHDVVVNSCTALTACLESNGDLTVNGGTGPYNWQSQSTFTDCSGCFGGGCVPFVCEGVLAPNWTDTGVTVADPGAGLYPIEVTDANGTTIVIASSGSLSPCTAGCVTTGVEGCGSGGYVWQYTITAGGSIDVTTLTPAGSWSVSYDNGATWTVLTAPSTINTAGDVWILGLDPDPADFLNFASGAWTFTDCSSTVNNVSVGHDCIIDACSPCGTTCTPPTLSDTQIDVTCLGGSDGSIDLIVTGTSTYDFAWSNAATTEDITGLTAGTYTVTVTDQVDGTCTANASVTIIDGGQPTVVANASITTICQGDPVTLTGSGATSYTWTGVIIPTDGVPFNPAATDTYTVTGTDGSGCTNTDQITVTVNNCTQPTASFVASNTTLCENDCISFTDQSTGTGITNWDWSFPGSTTATSTDQNPTNICYPTAGTYDVTLTVTDANGTDDSTIVSYVTVTNCTTPIANFSISDTEICQGDCIDFTDLSTGGATSWEWTFSGGLPSSSADQNPTDICFINAATVNVTLVASNSQGSDTIVQTVLINPIPFVDAGPDVTINAGTSTTLEATGSVGTYIWSPDTELTCTYCEITEASPESTTIYIVTVTDVNGCISFDDVEVSTILIEGIGVPSAFSPNGDNLNDILYVEGAAIAELEFIVYNRYGQKVFESFDKDFGWDGTLNGKPENPGVFAYVVIYKLIGGEEGVMKGDVTLIK